MPPNNDQRPGRPAGGGGDLWERLARLNPTVVVFVVLAMFLGVLLLPDVIGAVLVLAIATALGWLLTRTWPVLTPGTRAVRLVVIGLLVVVAVLKLTV